MSTFDLFISYAHADNQQGRVTQLVEHICKEFETFAGRKLNPFFDLDGIRSMDDWQHRILQGLRESRLFIAVLSPNYLKSTYCRMECTEYFNHELSMGLVNEGMAPIYFVEIDWNDKHFEQKTAEWVTDLRRRQHIDLQPWYYEGEDSLRNLEVQGRIKALVAQIKDRVVKAELRRNSRGNIDRFNVHFSGRMEEMRLLRESVPRPKWRDKPYLKQIRSTIIST
jgi:hypothetical protein